MEKFSYSNEEKETVLRFDYVDQCWHVESNVPSHITRLLKVGEEIEVLTIHDSGKPSKVKGKLSKPQISFRSLRKGQENELEEVDESIYTVEQNQI